MPFILSSFFAFSMLSKMSLSSTLPSSEKLKRLISSNGFPEVLSKISPLNSILNTELSFTTTTSSFGIK